jgi:hypothetical protein
MTQIKEIELMKQINKVRLLLYVMLMAALTGTVLSQPVDSTTLNSNNITSTLTLSAGTRYILKQFVYVKAGATLVIPAGTIIQGDKGNSGANILPGCLIIERGAKIYANGTAQQPIIFTSRIAPGLRGPGDWGGVILLGKARINTVSGADTNAIEGFPANVTPAYYGGQDDNDSSGVMRYVRIEFPGINLTGVSGNEINGLTMGAVGSKTVLEYIQVSYSGDDSFEWFGGNVNCKWLIAYKGVDDDFDTDNGYRGKNQFLLGIRDSNIADVSGSNGFESDNNANSPSNYNSPRTRPLYSNVTIVGPLRTLTTPINSNFKRGGHLRRNTQTDIYNSIIMGYPVGLRLDGNGVANECLNDTMQLRNNIFAGNTTLADTAGITVPFNAINWLTTASFNNRVYNVNDSLKLTNPYGYENGGSWVPMGGSPALSGSAFSNPNLSDPFFTNVSYVGAFGATDWTAGWANFNPLGYVIGIQQISSEVPAAFGLSQNYPNPFNPTTNIKFELPVSGFAVLKIYDVIGREVKTLINGQLTVGTYKADFDASQLTSGVYFYRLTVKSASSEWTQTRKMMLVK